MGTQMVGPLLVEEGMKDIGDAKIIRGKVMQSSSLICMNDSLQVRNSLQFSRIPRHKFITLPIFDN